MSIAQRALRLAIRPLLNERHQTGRVEGLSEGRAEGRVEGNVEGRSKERQGVGGVATASAGSRHNLACR